MAYFGRGSGPVHIGATQCDGNEQRIVDCTLTTENNCLHSEDAGVECSGENINLFFNHALDIIFPTIYSAPCTPEGGVRLTGGGDRPSRGTVWVCISGTWSTVCANFWNIPDARVVCRQLGYGSQGEFPRTIAKICIAVRCKQENLHCLRVHGFNFDGL